MSVKRKSLAANALFNGIKQCCIILFPLITFPYVSRVLGPSNYGKVSFSLSIISYITLIAGLGINNYAIREGARVREDKNCFSKIASEIFSINILSTIVAMLILVGLIGLWAELQEYRELLLILSLSVIFTTIGADWINSAYEDYLYITLRYIVCHLVSLVCIFVFVRNGNDYIVYSIISVIPVIMSNMINCYHIRKTIGIKRRFVVNFDLDIHIKPIFLIFATAVAQVIYINSDITIIGVFCSDELVGNYSVAAKIYTLIKQLINSIMIVAIPRVSNMMENMNLRFVKDKLTRIINVVFILLVPMATGLFMLRREVVLIISGTEYQEAIAPLGVLSISLLFASIACFYINVIMLPYKMEKKILIYTVISAVVNVILNYILIPLIGITAAAITTFFSEIIMFGCGFVYTRDFVSYTKKPILSGLLNGGLVFVICLVFRKYMSHSAAILICSIVVSGIGFLAVCFGFYRKDIIFTLKARKQGR